MNEKEEQASRPSPPPREDFSLEDILAEYGAIPPQKTGYKKTETPVPPAPKAGASEIRMPDIEIPNIKMPDIETPDVEMPDIEAREMETPREPRRMPEGGKTVRVSFPLEPEKEWKKRTEKGWKKRAEKGKTINVGFSAGNPLRPGSSSADIPAGETVEDIVAETVDAVKEDRQKRQEQFLQKLHRQRQKAVPKWTARQEPPPEEEAPPLREAQLYHKGRWRSCRRGLRLSSPVLLLMWLPWLLGQCGIDVPFFSQSEGNAALITLALQGLVCCLCWPVFRAAMEQIGEGVWTAFAYAGLANVVAMLDEATLLLLPERATVAPMGSVAALTAVFSLWGLRNYHRGMWETLRLAAMGEPAAVVDCGETGIYKSPGRLAGFFTRCGMEDSPSHWQKLLLPVLAVASLVFAVLSTWGRERGQDFLWCWSVILCTSSALATPLSYMVPFGRLTLHLIRSGAAIAGEYGAAVLAQSRRLVVTDEDLFPKGTVALAGLKLYGEERERAIAYAASLAVTGGGGLAQAFKDVCLGEGIQVPAPEHFHVHEDGGLSGMLSGETVLLGTPAFMRRKAIRLPPTLPSKTTVCLAVDGNLTAAFVVKYEAVALVRSAIQVASRGGLQLLLATRDTGVTPKMLKNRFGMDGGAAMLDVPDRLALSDPCRPSGEPCGVLYREGLYPYVDLVTGSQRLCRVTRMGTALSCASGILGALLSFYLAFTGSYTVLTPVLTGTYLLLWAVPVMPLVWGVDKP